MADVHNSWHEIEQLQRRLNEVDAQLTAEGRIHALECMALRAEKDAEIARQQTANDYAFGELAKLRAEIVRLKQAYEILAEKCEILAFDKTHATLEHKP